MPSLSISTPCRRKFWLYNRCYITQLIAAGWMVAILFLPCSWLQPFLSRACLSLGPFCEGSMRLKMLNLRPSLALYDSFMWSSLLTPENGSVVKCSCGPPGLLYFAFDRLFLGSFDLIWRDKGGGGHWVEKICGKWGCCPDSNRHQPQAPGLASRAFVRPCLSKYLAMGYSISIFI